MSVNSLSSAPPPESGSFRVRNIFYAAAVVLLGMAFFSYSPQDAAALSGGSAYPPENWIGTIGARCGFAAFHLFGVATYFILLLLVLRLIRVFIPARPLRFWTPLAGAVMATAAVMLFLALAPEPFAPLTERLGIGRAEVPSLALSGGVVGQHLAAPAVEASELPEGVLRRLIGAMGTLVLAWALLLSGGIMLFLADWAAVLKRAMMEKTPAYARDDALPEREEEEEEKTAEP